MHDALYKLTAKKYYLYPKTAKRARPLEGKRMYFKFPDVRYQLANKDRNSIFAEKRQKRDDQVF